MTALAFWLAVAMIAYTYVGYPLAILALGHVRGRGVRKRPVTPPMSLIIAAYNEETVIADRLENALSADYPSDSLEVLVASDGSSDATNTIVASFAPRGVRLLTLPRRGKMSALQEAIQQARGEILVFSDANTAVDGQALRALAANFADPEVGGVAGHSRYRADEGGESSSRGERLYWRYDTRLKELESRTGSVVSAHGGLYAIRRALYRPSAETAVTDDFVISTAVVEQGYRLVFEPGAVAWEVAVPEAAREFRRKVRLMTRAWRSIAVRRRLLNPFRFGTYSVVLLSHKVMRRALPLLLFPLLACSLVLAPQRSIYLAAAAVQCAVYGLGLVGWALRRTGPGQWPPLYVPFFFCMANAAALMAFTQFARGHRIDRWQPQRHPVPTAPGPTG